MEILQDISLKKYTTFNIGGNCQYFASPSNVEEIAQSIDFAKKNNLNIYYLGGGANTLVPDNGVKGLVVYTGNLNKIALDGNCVIAECGVKIDDVVDFAIEHNLGGLEFAYGLPGTVGGAVSMNARCYGSEFSSVIKDVTCVDYSTGKTVTFSKEQMRFAYKHSLLTDEIKMCCYSVTFCLQKCDGKQIRQTADANKLDRKTKGQYDYPSAGCIFKNNYEIGIPAGKLIEQAGLKSVQIGGARVYDKHANFIVNTGDATASDVTNLIEHIVQTVGKKGYKLEKEVKILGEPNA